MLDPCDARSLTLLVFRPPNQRRPLAIAQISRVRKRAIGTANARSARASNAQRTVPRSLAGMRVDGAKRVGGESCPLKGALVVVGGGSTFGDGAAVVLLPMNGNLAGELSQLVLAQHCVGGVCWATAAEASRLCVSRLPS